LAALHSDEESERIAEQFLGGKMSVEQFVSKYLQKRTVSVIDSQFWSFDSFRFTVFTKVYVLRRILLQPTNPLDYTRRHNAVFIAASQVIGQVTSLPVLSYKLSNMFGHYQVHMMIHVSYTVL
jgi:hypothetical protein